MEATTETHLTAACRRKRRGARGGVRSALVAMAMALLATGVANAQDAATTATPTTTTATTSTTGSTSTAAPAVTAAAAAATNASGSTAIAGAGVVASSGAAAATSSSSTATGYVLQRNAKLTDDNSIMEIVHVNDDGSDAKQMVELQTIKTPSEWTLNTWDASFAALETAVKAATPTLTYLELNVGFGQTAAAVKSLLFQHDTTWGFGPTLVFNDQSLGGLTSLETLKFVKFNVTFAEVTWLPYPTTLTQLAFDGCTIPNFNVNKTVKISDAVFRDSSLTNFPTFLLNLETPLSSLTLEGNTIVRPIFLTTAELDQLKAIPKFVNENNKFVSDSGAAVSTASAVCNDPQEYKGMPVCVFDLEYRSAKKDLTDGSTSGSTSASGTAPSSNKLVTSVIVILSVCGVAIVVIGSLIIRKRRRTTSYSGDTRSSFYENSDVLLSPSKLEPKLEEVPVANPTPGGVADLDLGREVIHLGKKLGIHGLRKGEYRDEPVVALRVSLRSLHISMREVNKIIASYIPFRHRNIVELIGTSMTALEDLLIVVEYMGKGSLRSVLRNPKIDLTWQDRLRMSADVCTAIDFIHSTRPNLVSKNLTSKSILCNNELVCKLDIFDYGRKVRDHVVPVLNFGQCDIATRAPEVLAGGPVTRAAEVYALGVIFCEISLRKMPFEDIITEMGPTLGDLHIAREVGAQRLQLKPSEEAPSEYQDLATRCLSFDPTRRPTVSEILKVLRAH